MCVVGGEQDRSGYIGNRGARAVVGTNAGCGAGGGVVWVAANHGSALAARRFRFRTTAPSVSLRENSRENCSISMGEEAGREVAGLRGQMGAGKRVDPVLRGNGS